MTDFSPPSGMGTAIFANKYQNPAKPDETFADRAEEVWRCNYALTGDQPDPNVLCMARQGILPTSGRHLQHMIEGETDGIRGEKVTNCSTAMFSFVKFFLLMQGSGVGRSYASDLCVVDWAKLPEVRFILNPKHPDWREDLGLHTRLSLDTPYDYFVVEDSAEGWARALEVLEVAAYHGKSDYVYYLDFSKVRCAGTPIRGQQGRPASGPVPLIQSLQKVASLRGTDKFRFEQAMLVDHWMSECVQLGGIRRSARIALKPWNDPLVEVLRFIECKRGGEMWSANNSLLVDEEFWRQDTPFSRAVFTAATTAAYFDGTGEPGFVNADLLTRNDDGLDRITPESVLTTLQILPMTKPYVQRMLKVAKAHKYNLIVNPCVTADTWVKTTDGYQQVRDLIGKPFTAVLPEGEFKSTGLGFFSRGQAPIWEVETRRGRYLRCSPNHRILTADGLVEAQHLKVGDRLHTVASGSGMLLDDSVSAARDTGVVKEVYSCQIPGPNKYSANGFVQAQCSEIPLSIWGGYCTIADICLANIDNLDDLIPAAEATASFLIRANTLPFMYEGEVARTNRIGVSFTGIFEFAWKHWRATFYDLLDPEHPMWAVVRQARDAVWVIAKANGCHTSTTIKPSGTIGKVMGCTEGAHLPAYGWYMRWVIYPQVSAEADALAAQGYPRRQLARQPNQIVGFPTKLALADMMGDALVLAGDPTPEQHYAWIRLLEANWVDSQVSYTLKYDPQTVDYPAFARTILEQQSTVRCCSVMPQVDVSAYEYQPEERITRQQYEEAMARINQPVVVETYDDSALICAGGVCPIEFDR